mmetsp:Transcript_54215/g.164149  ORF Transcript_54215/g.164149 Transcript_54215/m.164149 type:complete len:237 (-) Transcript_54215:70-780(-)
MPNAASPSSASTPTMPANFGRHVISSALTALLLTGCASLLRTPGPSSGGSGAVHIVRREPWPADPARAARARQQEEARAAASASTSRPAEWGELLRREAKPAAPAVAAGGLAVLAAAGAEPRPTPTPGRPVEWGPLMRREPRPSQALVRERPQEWGSLMRREARLAAPPAAPLPPREVATQRPSAQSPAGSGGFALRGLFCATVALVGFALQAKSAAATLLQLPALEHYWPKGKAK